MSSQAMALFDRLRAVASPWDVKGWENKDGYYVAAARVSSSDIPELIELVNKWNDDDWLDEVVCGDMDPHDILLLPVNAWRTLADLKAESAAEPLVEMLCSIEDFDAWSFGDLPIAIGKLGEAAIEPLIRAAQDVENETQARMIAVNGLRNIARFHPCTRERIVASLTQFVNAVVAADAKFNSNLLCALDDLRAES